MTRDGFDGHSPASPLAYDVATFDARNFARAIHRRPSLLTYTSRKHRHQHRLSIFRVDSAIDRSASRHGRCIRVVDARMRLLTHAGRRRQPPLSGLAELPPRAGLLCLPWRDDADDALVYFSYVYA